MFIASASNTLKKNCMFSNYSKCLISPFKPNICDPSASTFRLELIVPLMSIDRLIFILFDFSLALSVVLSLLDQNPGIG